jgi:phytoene dehydrogenase-like protein
MEADVADAVVVGSGPNGLVAAVMLAEAGMRVTVIEGRETVGGGLRSAELTVPGVVHDVCSAIHVLGAASPFLAGLGLERHGLRWLDAPVSVAHPLDDGSAAVQHRTLDETADALGADGRAWRRMMEPLVEGIDELLEDVLRPILGVPRHPLLLSRFGLRALPSATLLARRLRTDAGRALLAGAAAHSIRPLDEALTAAAGVVLLAAGQAYGWPVAAGGSQSIADALTGRLLELGGRVETGRWVTELAELPAADVTLLDVAPEAFLRLAGDQVSDRERAALGRWRHGPGSFKLDLAIEGPVPWRSDAARRAGTLHLGGTLEEIVHSEAEVAAGRMADQPYTLVGQQHLADPSRSAGEVHPLWVYCHVPAGYDGDATEPLLRQLERFAPGIREQIVASVSTGPAQLAAYNPNYVGGDIATGANDPRQLILRPRLTMRPYHTSIPGTYLCSAATPPGAGVHGACGAGAASAALRELARG